ncbi:MAG TPA: endonuclease/exonuclease/phosphatase family protein [Kofleriaceae bacterium]|nr:endonuclease/exonuclease/phosphatase family protein [Kofleriaceae bacterium]
MRGPVARAFVIALSLLAACGGGDDPAPLETSIEVVSINLRHDVDEWERRFALIADEIVRLDPDLIGLQEIEITGVDQTSALLALIADRGGADYEFYEELKVWPYGAIGGEGVGILSRFPILETGLKDLIEGGRVTVWTRVEVAEGYELDFFNTHLEADDVEGQTAEEIRVDQAGFTVEFMAAAGDERIQILTGDMNTTDDTEAYDVLVAGGLVDTYRAVHGDETATTGNTSPIILMEGAEQDPRRRIDYVFASDPPPEGATVTPADSVVCFQNHDEAGFYPSDHLGVMTSFDLVIPGR